MVTCLLTTSARCARDSNTHAHARAQVAWGMGGAARTLLVVISRAHFHLQNRCANRRCDHRWRRHAEPTPTRCCIPPRSPPPRPAQPPRDRPAGRAAPSDRPGIVGERVFRLRRRVRTPRLLGGRCAELRRGSARHPHDKWENRREVNQSLSYIGCQALPRASLPVR